MSRLNIPGPILTTIVMAVAVTAGGIPVVAAESEPAPDAELVFELDMDAIHDAFAANGGFEITVPRQGTVTLSGQPVRFSADNYWTEIQPDGSVVRHEYRTKLMEGEVAGIDGSDVRILLGEHGLYGTVLVPSKQDGVAWEHNFDPIETKKGEFKQRVESRKIPLPPEPTGEILFGELVPPNDPSCTQIPAPQGCDWPCLREQSFVQLDVEQGLMNLHSDWVDRTISSFTGHHGSWEMWKDVCLELLMQSGSPRAVGWSLLDNNEATTAVGEYMDWLWQASRLTGANSYQFWVSVNLVSGTLDAFGGARSNSAVRFPAATDNFAQSRAANVVEGHDFSGDNYNANRFEDRARVAGEESSHNYGEETHRSHCKSSGVCTLMGNYPTWDESEYWIDASRCEVYRYYFHAGDEYDGSPEPCPNWYQP